jgi:hypothetical protein
MLSRKIKILILMVCLSLSGYVHASPSFSVDTKFGFSAFNAEGLNKITEGLDAGYGTSFGHIRMPLAIGGGFSFGFSRSAIGLEAGYEFANRSSFSTIYNITESIKYSAFPLGVRYSYRFYKTQRWSFMGTLSTGIMWTWFSMNTRPDVTGVNSAYESGATAWYLSPAFEVLYSITDNIGVSALLGGRYANTSKFKYNSADSRHNNGDFVTFSDGSNLTMNVSGLKFSLGITLTWS